MHTSQSEHGIAHMAEVRRGNTVESRHFGSIAIVDSRGRLQAKVGNPASVTFMRSSAKPFQAMPLLLSGAADQFAFSPEEIAIACGSQNGEPLHTQTVEKILGRAHLAIDELQCGLHEPFSKAVADAQRSRGLAPTLLQNNCSGKHAAMLCLAQHLKAPTATYLLPDHPVQKAIRNAVAEFSGLPDEKLLSAIDGCGVPTFALPLRAMALMFARLRNPARMSHPAQVAAGRIVHVMSTHPQYVAGDNEFDTELMRETGGRIISKIGAEGIWCAAVLIPEQPSDAWGIALKIEDGSPRARAVIAMEILRQLKLITPLEAARLERFAHHPVRNNRGEIVGETRPAFDLQRG